MEKKIESAEEKLALIRKGFPKDPCRDCLFEEDDGCNCQDRKDYRAKLQHLRDIGVYDLMYDIQEIESQRSWIVWIRREKGENDERIASIQKEINELEKKCEDALTQLKEAADEVKKNKKTEAEMYKIIENGIERLCSVEEAEAVIAAFNKRNHIFSVDEMWRTQKVIYLNDQNAEAIHYTKQNPLIVTYVGRGGTFDVPCYMDQEGRYYFDENNGRNGLDLYTGAWKNEDGGEICGEPNEHVTRPVICEDPFVRSDYEFDFRILSRLKMDCDYFLGCGNGYEGHLHHKTVEKQCDEMEKMWNALPTNERPEWLTLDQIKEYRSSMLKKRAEQENKA